MDHVYVFFVLCSRSFIRGKLYIGDRCEKWLHEAARLVLGSGIYHWDTVHSKATGFFANQRSRGSQEAKKKATGGGEATGSAATKTRSDASTPATARRDASGADNLPKKKKPVQVIVPPVPRQQCYGSSSFVLIPTLLWYAGLVYRCLSFSMSMDCDVKSQLIRFFDARQGAYFSTRVHLDARRCQSVKHLNRCSSLVTFVMIV